MKRHVRQDHSDQPLIVGIIAVLLAMFMLSLFYTKHKRRINAVFVHYISTQLSLIAPFSKTAAGINQRIKAADPQNITLKDFWLLAGYAGKKLRWVIWPLSLCFAGLVYFHWGRIESFKRKFTMQTLLANNAKIFAQIAPVVNRERPISDEPIDRGPWKVARTPLQFCLENGLIVDQDNTAVACDAMLGSDGLPDPDATTLRLSTDMCLDQAKAEYLFVEQLGDVFNGPQNLAPHQKALAAAFLAYGHSDRTAGIAMLNQLSLSFRQNPPKDSNEPFTLDTCGADALLEKYCIEHRQLIRHASYTNCWMSALLEFAREKGVLACSMFIWLRPADRTLWYALNQCGRRVAWTEAAGVRAHLQAERKQARAINTAQVEQAVLSLEQSLADAGYIFAINDDVQQDVEAKDDGQKDVEPEDDGQKDVENDEQAQDLPNNSQVKV
jgi:hypothetical protein